MPVYTYRCDNCGVQFDRQQKFSDAPLAWCPECNKKALRKVFQPVGIVFKGSGFYATDHRSPSGAGRGKSGDHEGKSEGSSESKPAESKPAEKSSGESKSE